MRPRRRRQRIAPRGRESTRVISSPGRRERATDLTVLRAELEDHIISEDGRGLPQVVIDLLAEREMTIAVAEMGTGGLVSARITRAEGAEHWFKGGTVVTSGDDNKGDPEALTSALAAREATVADVGVGVGPIIVPEDSKPDNPYGLVCAAVNVRGQESYHRLQFNGDRARVREWATDGVLALVREILLEL